MIKIIEKMREEKGAAAVEYALLVGLIAVVAVGAVTLLGGNVKGVFDFVANAFPTMP